LLNQSTNFDKMLKAKSYSFQTQLIYLWKSQRPVIYMLCFFFLLLILFTFSRVRNSDNTRSRIITVERLVEKGSFAHVAPGDTTPFPLSIDAVMVGDKMYSSKPPVYPMLMAGESLLLKFVTGWDFYSHRKDFIRFLTLVNQVIPYMIVLLLAMAMASWYFPERRTLVFMLLFMTVASLPYAYSVTINNHSIAATSFFMVFYLVWLILYQRKRKARYYVLTGLLAGLGASTDLPGLVFALAALGALYLTDAKKASLAAMLVFAFLALSAGIYWKLTGSIKPIYLQGSLYHYSGSYWQEREAFDLLKENKLRYLFHITFGHHGLFSVTPVLLISLWSLLRTIIKRDWELRPVLIAFAAAALLIFLFVLFRTGNYGGYAIGMRWFVLFMPILSFASAPLIHFLSQKKWGFLLLIFAILWSMPAVAEALYYEAFYRSWLDRLWLSF